MFHIREAIAVEGRYDKNALSQVVDTLILETGGFQIFSDPEKMALLDRAAKILGELYQMQKSPYEILGALSKQLRQFYSARLALDRGKGSACVKELWGMSYPPDRLMNSARRFSLPWCRRAVLLCARTDLDMKSTGQDPNELLTTLLLELANTV